MLSAIQVLAYCVSKPEALKQVNENDFLDFGHKEMFGFLHKGGFASLEQLKEKIPKHLHGLLNQMLIYVNDQEYACALEDLRILGSTHRYAELFEKGVKLYMSDISPEDKLTEMKKLVEQISIISFRSTKYQVEKNPNLSTRWLEHYSKPVEKKLLTGLNGIDEAFGGFSGTEFAIILADTNVGKTTLLLNMVRHMLNSGKRILFFSLEMSQNEIMDKMIAIWGDYNAMELRNRIYRRDMVEGVVQKFSNLPLTIVYGGSITSNDVVNEAYAQRENIDVVMVDYLQRLADPSNRDGETIRLKKMSQNLKNAALALGKPIITPVQVDKESAKSGKIDVNNVAWSKDIANEADIAFYLYEKKSKNSEGLAEISNSTELHVKIVKSRHSAKDTDITLDFSRFNLRMNEYGK